MKLNLHLTKLICTVFFLSILSAGFSQNEPAIQVPISNVKIEKLPCTFTKVTTTPIRPMSPAVVDPNAVYSNITNFTGSGGSMGISAAVATVRMTALVADRISMTGVAPYPITQFKFSAGNLNAGSVDASVRVRFYQNSGTNKPGTYIGGYDFTNFVFAGSSVYTFTFAPASLIIPSNDIWIGISFSEGTYTTRPTLTQLANMGFGLYNPVDVGSSADELFETTSAGVFAGNNPTGTVYSSPYLGSPIANIGWEMSIAAPLPVAIQYLHGAKAGNNHNLSWKVNTTNAINMSLERSTDNRNFSNVYNTSGDAVSCQQAFNFTDARPTPGVNFYRLKVTDADGKISYSQIIALLNKNAGFEIISISPNPIVTGNAVLNVTSAQPDQLQIAIYDMTGRKVATQSQQLIAGSNQIILNVSKLASGAYQVTGVTNTGESKTIKLLKK